MIRKSERNSQKKRLQTEFLPALVPNTGPGFSTSLEDIILKSLSLSPGGMMSPSSFSFNQIFPVPPAFQSKHCLEDMQTVNSSSVGLGLGLGLGLELGLDK